MATGFMFHPNVRPTVLSRAILHGQTTHVLKEVDRELIDISISPIVEAWTQMNAIDERRMWTAVAAPVSQPRPHSRLFHAPFAPRPLRVEVFQVCTRIIGATYNTTASIHFTCKNLSL